jgi:DNA-binding NarL/FixJ family response regulator
MTPFSGAPDGGGDHADTRDHADSHVDTGGDVRVVLVDDHAVVRSGLAQLLGGADDIEVVGQAGEGAEAVELVRRTRPDVVVMDLQMPGMDGVEATRRIVEEGLGAEVVVLTSYSDSTRIVAALDAGAVGYLLKDADPEDVLAGVRAVSRGESPLDPKVARRLLTDRVTPAGSVQLTPREAEVLSLVRSGLANKQIARRLGISERTVKAHLTSVFQRIGVVDRTQAALWAERNL